MKQKNAKDEKLTLAVNERKVFGKKLKKLRTEGEIPGNIYGPGFKSQAVSASYKLFTEIFRKAKETGIVYLQYKKEEIPVLIQHLQKHPVESHFLHVDFRKIDLKQKIETSVPIKIIGESEAVAQKGGVLLTQSDHLIVEALPADIPQEIEIDISALKEVGQDIKIIDLPKSSTYEVKEEPDKIIVSVVAHKEESLIPETTATAPEVITEVKEGEEGEEGATSAPEEAEKKPSESKEPEEKQE